jgi:Archaeal holliday junction resolvase (hjc)
VPIRINGPLSEARLERVVANMFREQGWNVLEQPEVGDGTPDFIASGRGKKLVIEVKRASEDRKDRIIPLLSRPRWRRPTIPASLPGHPIPVAIVGANRIPESVAEEAKQFVRERAAAVLGIGFVHGVKPYLYLERLNADVLNDLGLSGNVEEANPEARNRRNLSDEEFCPLHLSRACYERAGSRHRSVFEIH